MKTMNLDNFAFLSPDWLWLIILTPFIGWWFYRSRSKALPIVSPRIWSHKKKYSLPLLTQSCLLVFIGCLGVCLFANPVLLSQKETVKKNGIDIVLVLDVSASMDAEDLPPSRIAMAKKILKTFLSSVTSDRVGLVVFSGRPYVSIPLTFDTQIITSTIDNTTTQTINQNYLGLDGTAIGDALLMARNMFQEKNINKSQQQEREKVVILITDGDANRGVEPSLAGQLLAKDHIRIFSIGIGSASGGFLTIGPDEQIPIPPLKGEELNQLSNLTNGRYFRPTDNEQLKSVFQELSKLQKHDLSVTVTNISTPCPKPFIAVLGILIILYSYILYTYQFIVWNSKN